MAASVLEAKNLLGSAASAANVVRASLSVRTPEDARARDGFHEYADLNDASWVRCMAELAGFARNSPRPWFVRVQDAKAILPRKPRKSPSAPLAAAGAVIALPVRSTSIASIISDAPVAMDIDGEPAPPAPPAPIASHATTNRWRNREDLRHDYAEYRSCCGSPAVWIKQIQLVGLAGPKIVADHCSHTPHAFFKARLRHRSEFTDKSSYIQAVVRELLHGKPHWMGYPVCCSCFRALLGFGRAAFFRFFNTCVSETQEAAPELTLSGALKKPRSAPLRSRAVELLRAFCLANGQHAPNQRGSDPSRIRYFLPQRLMSELQQALATFEQEKKMLQSPEPLTISAIYRGEAKLAEENFFFSLGKGNSLCRCGVCDELDNQCTPTYVKEYNLDRKDVLRFRAQKLSHLAQMREQRECFDSHKEKAMKQPLDEWCITFDGMDQSKTQLPSRARFSKDLEPLAQLKSHWIGAFCFGGPDPVLGLMNTPELRKDAALSVVTLERILDIQWLQLEKEHSGEGRVADMRSKAAASQAASIANEEQVPDELEMTEEKEGPQQLDSSTVDSSTAAYSGPGKKWPRRLHVTFDNASGECKNQWMMRFLGLLVFHGVFEAITASMLLVGHTHDIVDQMFSVWARMLRIHNAETYEKMRSLFRDKYHTRIEGLVQLMNGQKEALDALTKEEREAYDAEIAMFPVDWTKEQAEILADFSAFVKKHGLLQPHIEQQTVTIDLEGWLQQAVAGSLPQLKRINKAYNFGVEKDKDGNVYLYNSQFAKSAESTTGKAIHSYPNQITGKWTTRALLYLASDPGLSKDPYRVPPLAIDLAPLHATVAKYGEHKAMSAEDQGHFRAMLDRLEEGQMQQKIDCEACYDALTSFGQHGVVSQRKKASEEEKVESKRKLSARAKSWEQLLAHLRDPAFAAAHDATMVHTGFWTKWLRRLREHIQPAYIERGYIFNPVDLAEPYHSPETQLCSGAGEPPVHSDRAERIDLIYLHNRGTPVAGQVAILRTDRSREPFYVGKIKAVRLSDHAMRKLYPELDREPPAAAGAPATVEPAAEQPTQAAPAAAAAAAPQPEGAQSPRLKDLEFQIYYYDLCWEDFNKFHLSTEKDHQTKKDKDNKFWEKQFADGSPSQTEAELTAAMKRATKQRKPPPTRPNWLVDLYAKARFLYNIDEKKEEKKATLWESGATMVAWGPKDALLKSAAKSGKGHLTWRLKEPVFRQVREDLTESKQEEVNESAPPQSSTSRSKTPGQARGARGKKKHTDVVQPEQAQSSEPEVEPEPAAATRPRLPRLAHANAAIVEDSNDEEEEEEEEEEEQEEVEPQEEEEEEEAPASDVEMASQSSSDEPPTSLTTRQGKQRSKCLILKQKAAQESAEVSPPKKQRKRSPAPAAAAAAVAATASRRASPRGKQR
jgi:hypothetical protein